MHFIKKTIFILSFCFLFVGDLFGASPDFYTSGSDKLMLDGYDVVSYYFSEVPREGSPRIEMEFGGVKWRFVSQSNLNRFKKNPGMFIPEFGGYCVWAIAHGRLSEGLPQFWRIIDGKLYLFCSEESMAKWLPQRELINRLALNNWPELVKKK